MTMCSTEFGGVQLQSDCDSPDFFADRQSHLVLALGNAGPRKVIVAQTQIQQWIPHPAARR